MSNSMVRAMLMATLAFTVGSGLTPAQTVTRTIIQNGQPVQVVVPAPGAQIPGAPAAPSPTTPADANAANQLRDQNLQQLEQLPFSRTPSVVFEAWRNNNLPKKKDEKSEQATAEEPMPPAPLEASFSNPRRFAKFTQELQQEYALGAWERVGEKLRSLPIANRDRLVKKLIEALSTDSPMDELTRIKMQQQGRGVDPRVTEKQSVSFADILSLAAFCSQRPLPEDLLRAMGQACYAGVLQGHSREELLRILDGELSKAETDQVVSRRQVALMLSFAGQHDTMHRYLPDLDEAVQSNDFEALNLLSVHYRTAYVAKPKTEILEKAWRASLAVLAQSANNDTQYSQAVTQTVDLAGKVRKELGQAWLNESFTAEPERGIALLGAIGRRTATSLQQFASDQSSRIQLLKLQNDSVNALLQANPNRAAEWKKILELLAVNWLREAGITYTDDESTSMGPQMRRDMYGNIFYYDERMGNIPYRQQLLAPIPTSDLIDARPSDQWIDLLQPSVQPQFWGSLAKLYLKVGEESLSFPYIERLGQNHKELAKALVEEFIRVWTKNHDPNSERRRSDYYMFMYGFESRAESIPLTRSKQVRNLKELSRLVPKLRELNEGKLDENLLVPAFMTCHSFAEVFRPEDLETVFGKMETIPPKIISQIAQKMRENLASVWRDVATQKTAQTKRTKKEVEAEVLRGYEAAAELLQIASERHPQDANLLSLRAALMHDENNYQSELKANSQFSGRRKAAFEVFQQSAAAYAIQLPQLEAHEYSTEVYERWFYAALGACDLALLDDKQISDAAQFELIANSIRGLPHPHDEWHLSRFANLLFNRMSAVKPAVKARYLRGGFAIVGDHPQARAAKQVFDYYNDLVTEIKLDMVLDGSANVGQEVFGVYVSLLHTREIERESGGFGRYLQNQANNSMFYYNYGRPLENYRDKFEEFVREAFKEHFDVQSVTFQVPDVKSRATTEVGWRITPYAYVLMKARGPQVDKIPPLKLDLDFLDTTGYAILPIESVSLPIDCGVAQADSRPVQNLAITQILDERLADEGELVLEVKSSGQGLVPMLTTIFGEVHLDDFDVTNIEDNGVSVTRFDPESATNTILSERTWLVHLKPRQDLEKRPDSFTFLTSQVATKGMAYQRYVDADLKEVQGVVALEEKYGRPKSSQLIWKLAGGAVVVLGALLVAWRLLRSKPDSSETATLPDDLSPFKAIALLQGLRNSNRLSPEALAELESTISDLHESFFDDMVSPATQANLKSVTERWLAKT